MRLLVKLGIIHSYKPRPLHSESLLVIIYYIIRHGITYGVGTSLLNITFLLLKAIEIGSPKMCRPFSASSV
jgi:hypothetical protein